MFSDDCILRCIMSFLRSTPQQPNLEYPRKLNSIKDIQGLPTRENDPDGPENIVAYKWRDEVMQVSVFKQEALDKVKTLDEMPKPYYVQLCTSSLGDGKLFVDMFFKLKQWETVKSALVLHGGFIYEPPMSTRGPTVHMGYFKYKY